MVVKCQICNKEFNALRSTRKYCDKCASTVKKQKDLCNSKRIQQKHQMHYTKKCKNCGKEFETTNNRRKYCSELCQKKARNEQNKKRQKFLASKT